jgi:serine/threonine protein phosphatase 1
MRITIPKWAKKGFDRPALLAPGECVYAIGDIHGCVHQLNKLLEAIAKETADAGQKRHRLVFIGDYVDRGPDSRAVVDRLLAATHEFELVALRGNHEQTLLDFLVDPTVYRDWRDFGGRETLLSYGVTPPLFDRPNEFERARQDFATALPPQHLSFLQSLPHFARIGGYYFAHAGVRPGTPLERQTERDLMWIREEFLSAKDEFGAIVVHGHTPSPLPIRCANRIAIDTGVYATGRLTAAVLEGSECRFLSVG